MDPKKFQEMTDSYRTLTNEQFESFIAQKDKFRLKTGIIVDRFDFDSTDEWLDKWSEVEVAEYIAEIERRMYSEEPDIPHPIPTLEYREDAVTAYNKWRKKNRCRF